MLFRGEECVRSIGLRPRPGACGSVRRRGRHRGGRGLLFASPAYHTIDGGATGPWRGRHSLGGGSKAGRRPSILPTRRPRRDRGRSRKGGRGAGRSRHSPLGWVPVRGSCKRSRRISTDATEGPGPTAALLPRLSGGGGHRRPGADEAGAALVVLRDALDPRTRRIVFSRRRRVLPGPQRLRVSRPFFPAGGRAVVPTPRKARKCFPTQERTSKAS